MSENIDKIISDQRIFFNTQKTKDLDFRVRQLKKLRSALYEFERDLYEALAKDLHRPKIETYGSEIGYCLNEISVVIKNLRAWASPVKAKGPKLFYFAKGSICKEPLGVVLIIGPWNYPLGLLITPFIEAIAAGNCVVLKPSEVSVNTALVIQKMIEKHFGKEYVSVIQGGPEATQELLKRKFDYIFFTGGEAVGKIVMKAASENLTPLTLELGGKSPCVVDANAHLERAASRICWGKFMNAGQTCIAPDYLLVDRKIKDQFVDLLKIRIIQFYGRNANESPNYGRIVNEKHFRRICGYLRDGHVVFGGQTDQKELYIAPTLIDNISLSAPVMQEEIFGPILPILEYTGIEDAISFINSRPKPLALYVFSDDKVFEEKMLSGTTSGGVAVNDVLLHSNSPFIPFGGVGSSGFGRYHGKYGFDAFSNTRSVLRNTVLFDNFRFPPYLKFGLHIIRHNLK
ncbi:MAG: aldehyde dehydrogenase family protein [Candidatus Omnitrophica bacterium]|nr:aldehyde dehydrogenase family protein [Candidatus Omnitrophota bacterium]